MSGAPGKTQHQISLVVNVTPQQVSQDLKRVREQWRSSTMQNFEQKVDIGLAKAGEVEHEALEKPVELDGGNFKLCNLSYRKLRPIL